MSTIAVNAITDASGGTTASINGYTPSASNMTGRNRIINGAMMIDQRNAGAAVTSGYPVDRWQMSNTSDGTFSAQQDSESPAGFNKSLKVTITAADTSLTTTQRLILVQQIEGYNLADLSWGTSDAKTVTLSFWVRSSLTGTFGGSLLNGSSNRSYPYTYSISAANTWEKKSITIAGDTTGTWATDNSSGMRVYISLGAGPDVSGTAGAWAGANYASATGATSVVGTNGATFYITGVQLEVGSTASEFEHRLYGQELALCQRYYSNSYANSGSALYFLFVTAYASSANTGRGVINLSPPMRAAPSFSYTGTINSNPSLGTISISSPNATIDTVRIDVNHTTAATAGYSYGLYSSDVVLSFSAEL